MIILAASLHIVNAAAGIEDEAVKFANANGTSIAYLDLGPKTAEPIVLIMGLSAQLTAWPDAFVQPLLDAGHRVVLFDNRDVGLSQKFYQHGQPVVWWHLLKSSVGLDIIAPYSLNDMAGDTIGLMDALNISKAHIVGASMGGMIAQICAIDTPERVLSLTSIMSTTGNSDLPVHPEVLLGNFSNKDDQSPEAIIENTTQVILGLSAPDYPTPELLKEKIRRSYLRSYYPPGGSRQLLASAAAAPRDEQLKQLKLPTLVMHGAQDPLFPTVHAEHLAKLVPAAELELIEGMGHNFEPKAAAQMALRLLRFIRHDELASNIPGAKL